jgi:hypothetical protein
MTLATSAGDVMPNGGSLGITTANVTGQDDLLTEPFTHDALQLRTRALLDRTRGI